MIEFYKAGTTEFEGGEILNEAYEAKIIHERNGRFDLEFKIPIQEVKFEMHDIFLAHVPYMGKQGFYLTDIKKKLNHIIIYAKHLFFMIDKNVTKDLHTLTNGDTGQLVMDKFQSSLQIPTQFNFTSDITDRHIFNKPSYNNALEVLTEGKHSILGQWEGVLVMDNFDIKLKKRWGRDTEYLIAKRKNISDLEIRDIGDNITTRLFLKKELEDKSVITAVIDSPLIDEYPQVYGEVRETTDQSIESVEDLIIHGENIFRTQRIDLPTESFEFEVTEDVKDYEFTIDDTALIYYSDYDIYKRVLISSYEYDPIEKKYLKIKFGERPKSMSQQVAEKVDKEYIKPTINSLDEIIAGIIEGLDDPTGGIIQFTEDAEGNIIEMLILDNEDRELAKDVWRFNIQGLSHSSNGINGDFDIALTQEGEIVADFIATGTLNAALIKTGILHSLEGNTWIDMETGYFKLGGMEYSEDGFTLRLASGKTVDELEKDTNNAKEDSEQAKQDAKDAKDIAEEAKGEIENIEVGARNLVQGSIDDTWEPYGSRTTITSTNGDKTLIITAKSLKEEGIYFGVKEGEEYRSLTLEEGETYTLSFRARGTVSLDYCHIINEGGTNQLLPKPKQELDGIKFKDITITFTANNGVEEVPYSYIAIGSKDVGEVGANKWFQIQEVKLEKGTVKTDWTESPEDIEKKLNKKIDQDDFSDLKMDLEEVQGEVEDRVRQSIFGDLKREHEERQDDIAESVTKANNAINEIAERTGGIETWLGEASKIMNFINTTITESENGILIENENTGILIAPEAIYFLDSGEPVAHITGQQLHITHGVFIDTLKVGKHQISAIEGENITTINFTG